MVKRILSKSQANLYLQCPYKWKKCYIDEIRSEPSYAQTRGIRIHKKVEEFYKKFLPDKELKNFIKFEHERIQSCFKHNKFEKKYFFPLFQELKMFDEKLGLKGFVDAVYINPEDDGVIVIDWKTGKYYPDKFDDYRFELAVYASLLRASGKVDNVKYWGIYFLDQDKLFFEKIDEKYITKMHETLETVRKGIAEGNHEPKVNMWCKYCQFYKECPRFK